MHVDSTMTSSDSRFGIAHDGNPNGGLQLESYLEPYEEWILHHLKMQKITIQGTQNRKVLAFGWVVLLDQEQMD
jgi:hypothetical protein